MGTHTFWYLADDPKLSRELEAQLESLENELWLSVGSLFEMSIKVSTGKLKLEVPFTDLVEHDIIGSGIGLLAIAPEHLQRLSSLPFHHKDPFDRLLVAQALGDDLTLLSRYPAEPLPCAVRLRRAGAVVRGARAG